MPKPNLTAFPVLAWATGVLLFSSACGATFPSVAGPPQLAKASVEAPMPPAPKMQDVKEVLTFAMRSDVVFVRPVPNFKERSLGLGAIEGAGGASPDMAPASSLLGLASLLTKGKLGVDGMPTAPRATSSRASEAIAPPGKLADMLISRLLKRGVSKIADLTAAGRGVSVTIDQDHAVSAAGAKGSVRWAGMLDKMVFVGRVSDADYILYGEIASAGSEVRPLVLGFSYDKVEMDRYNAAYIPWRQQTEQRLAANQRALSSYGAQFGQAKDAYLKDGGKFPPPADEADKPAAVHWAEYSRFSKSATELNNADKQALAATPAPGTLVDQANTRKQNVEVKVATVSMVVKLIDASTKEIVWMQTLSKSDETLPACYGAVLDKIVADLLAGTP